METVRRGTIPQRFDRVGVDLRGDYLPHQRGSHQAGVSQRTDENRPQVVSRKTGENRASHTTARLCTAEPSGTKTGSDQTGRVIQFSSPQAAGTFLSKATKLRRSDGDNRAAWAGGLSNSSSSR